MPIPDFSFTLFDPVANIGTTMNLYVQTMSEDRIEAQRLILEKMMQTLANGPVN